MVAASADPESDLLIASRPVCILSLLTFALRIDYSPETNVFAVVVWVEGGVSHIDCLASIIVLDDLGVSCYLWKIKLAD